MKRFSVMIAFILSACILLSPGSAFAESGTVAAMGVADNVVRVHLASYGLPGSISMNAVGTHTITDNGKPLSGAFTVSANGAGIKITAGGATYALDGDVYITAGSYAPSDLFQINNSAKFVGDLRILNKNGGLKIINHVDLENFVAGVIPYEMSNSWPAEALKAQAIATRTFAYYIMGTKNRDTAEHDLTNTTNSYYGWNDSYANCVRAVNDTKNQILKTPSGTTAYACYSASNGGATEYPMASGAAGSNLDYLPYKQDPYDLAAALASSGYSARVTIPKTISAADLRNSAAQPYLFLREKLAAAGVSMSSVSGTVTVRGITLTAPKHSGPDRSFQGARIVLGLPGKDVTLDFAPYVSGTAKYPFLNSVLNLGTKYSMLYLQDSGGSYLLAAVRYGHASGMSQIGAWQMANQGLSCGDILEFYYNLGTACSLVTMPWATPSPSVPTSSAAGSTTPASGTGTVVVPGSLTLNVRSGPGTNYSIIGSLANNASVTVSGESASWYQIAYGSQTGYVSKDFVKLGALSGSDSGATQGVPSEAAQTPPATLRTGSVSVPAGLTLNVRGGPGTNYSIIGSLANGATVTISGDSGSWYQIAYGSQSAYVSKDFVKAGDAETGSETTASQTTAAQTQTGTVSVASGLTLNVRNGPGTGSAIIGSIANNASITIKGESGGWYQITYGSQTAYVSKDYVRISGSATQTEKAGTVNVPNATVLNVRSGPGMSYNIIATYRNGTQVTILSQSDSWCKIRFGNGEAYVHSSYIRA